MQKIDLIIGFCEKMTNMQVKGSAEALAAARELRDLKPEHPLDKKADNARELGLDYEPDHGFDRTASHMAGEYVSTNQQNVNTSEERVHKSDKSIHEMQRLGQELEQKPVAYLYYDAPCAEFANPLAHSTLLVLACDRNPIYSNETPLYTAPPKPWVGLTDEEISDTYNKHYNDYVSNDIGIVDFIVIARAIEQFLRIKNEHI
jgi:hypothetical protein